MIRTYLLVIGFLLPGFAFTSPDCEPFELLLRDSGNGFAEVKGKGVLDSGRRWTDLVWKLPGATECSVRQADEDAPMGTLHCTWVYGHFANGAQVRTDATNLVQGALACLAPLLTEEGSVTPSDRGGRIYRGIKGSKDMFDFYVTSDSTSKGWSLLVSVERSPNH